LQPRSCGLFLDRVLDFVVDHELELRALHALPVAFVGSDELLEVLPVNRCRVAVVMEHYGLASELDCDHADSLRLEACVGL